jgi:hypothetical protein
VTRNLEAGLLILREYRKQKTSSDEDKASGQLVGEVRMSTFRPSEVGGPRGSALELAGVVRVVLEAAQRPLTIYEIAEYCVTYQEEFVSYFDVKQACMSLLTKHLVSLESADPLTFLWCKKSNSENVA